MAFDFLIFQDHCLLKPLPTLESFQRTGIMMMSNGFGAFFGVLSAVLLSINFHQGAEDWHNIWLSGYALIIAIALLFCLSTNIMRRMLLV
jgi:hypothetical protein